MLTVLEHPLITHKLSRLRCKETGTKEFRESLNEIAALMAYETTRNLPLKETEIETPLATMKTGELTLDSSLNDHGYILPGLGDAGDRLFGTK